MSVQHSYRASQIYAPPPTLEPSEPLFLKVLFVLIYFALSRQQIRAFQRGRTAAVVVFPPYEEQTEERKGDVCTTKNFLSNISLTHVLNSLRNKRVCLEGYKCVKSLEQSHYSSKDKSKL